MNTETPNEPGNEVVIEGKAVPAVAMDAYTDLLAEEQECASMIRWWEERRKVVKKHLAKLMGERTVGTVGGIPAIYYEYQERFNATNFKKENPNMYQAFTAPVTVTQFDEASLRRARRDLWEKYQVRSMRVTWTAPGSGNRHGEQAPS